MELPPMERALSTDVVSRGHHTDVSHLKVRDLLSCRKVSKCWNKAASSVLRRRSTMIKKISEETDLMELEECMTTSSDFPFAGLEFIKPWRLSSARVMEYFRNYGATFTRVRLGTTWQIKLQDQARFIHHLPRLSILEVVLSSSRPSVELWDSTAGQEDGKILNLQSLRTFRTSYALDQDILQEVLTAASPSLEIECLWTSYETLRALISAGKLRVVSVMTVDEYGYEEADALRMSELLSTESPMLTKLDFSVHSCLSVDVLKKILISSQHTLKELRLHGICPSEFSEDCPVFAKLSTLTLRIVDQSYEYVFQGGQGHRFPALKELILDVTCTDYDPSIGNLSDGVFIVPSLTRIDVHGYVNKYGIEDLARSFPNVIEIRLIDDLYNSGWAWKGYPVEIWSVGAFKFLEKLRIWHYRVQRPTKNSINMDSFLTGIPMAICENLRRHTQQNLVDSPFNDILRSSPSILNLTNLKELIVGVKPDLGLEELPEEPPFISMVSVWYALQMMPNLQAKFVYEYEWPTSSFEEKERDKEVAILKAAFKHVQPYVELEYFFY